MAESQVQRSDRAHGRGHMKDRVFGGKRKKDSGGGPWRVEGGSRVAEALTWREEWRGTLERRSPWRGSWRGVLEGGGGPKGGSGPEGEGQRAWPEHHSRFPRAEWG